jgi:hypothetical protein
MSRAGTGETIVVQPANNVYTALVIVATLIVLVGLIVLFLRAQELFPPDGLLGY